MLKFETITCYRTAYTISQLPFKRILRKALEDNDNFRDISKIWVLNLESGISFTVQNSVNETCYSNLSLQSISYLERNEGTNDTHDSTQDKITDNHPSNSGTFHCIFITNISSVDFCPDQNFFR